MSGKPSVLQYFLEARTIDKLYSPLSAFFNKMNTPHVGIKGIPKSCATKNAGNFQTFNMRIVFLKASNQRSYKESLFIKG